MARVRFELNGQVGPSPSSPKVPYRDSPHAPIPPHPTPPVVRHGLHRIEPAHRIELRLPFLTPNVHSPAAFNTISRWPAACGVLAGGDDVGTTVRTRQKATEGGVGCQRAEWAGRAKWDVEKAQSQWEAERADMTSEMVREVDERSAHRSWADSSCAVNRYNGFGREEPRFEGRDFRARGSAVCIEKRGEWHDVPAARVLDNIFKRVWSVERVYTWGVAEDENKEWRIGWALAARWGGEVL
ncbi:hypothetical protein C8J57DRAFT_1229865 [Mycena rebaudengoi]|nr:hypothetical protein C8J57DRAFT_1229865 [Mycena rebaudengoi]